MKKIFILGLACLMTFPLAGCTFDKVEKEPVIIGASDKANSEDSKKDNILSDSGSSQDNSTDNFSDSGSSEEATVKQPEQGSDNNSSNGTDTDNPTSTEDSTANDTASNGTTNENAQNINNDTYQGIVMLEGMEEAVTYKTYYSDLGYQIAYDVDRFTVTTENDKDTFMAENPNPELYPYVFFTIGRNVYTGEEIDINDSDLHLRDDETGKDLVANSEKDTVKIGAYDAIHWQLIDGNEWNSLVKNYYYIKGEKYYYWIQTNYFLEASEGFGARISAMLDTFVIE